MPRTASEQTLAIRDLLEKSDGAITHDDAREKFKGKFPIAKKPGPKSDNLKAWEKCIAQWNKPKNETEADNIAKAAAQELSFSRNVVAAIRAELDTRKEFKAEQNNFDVTKHNWLLAHGRKGQGRKPRSSKDDRAKTAAKTGARRVPTTQKTQQRVGNKTPRRSAATTAPPPLTDVDALKCLKEVEAVGGADAVRKQIADLTKQAEDATAKATEMQGWLDGMEKLKSALDAAA